MPGLTTVALIGSLVLGAAGTGVQFAASQQAAEAQERGLRAQQQAEETRKAQLGLESQRKKREIIRQGIIARSQATSTATNQGAQHGTALPGALAGISGTAYSGYSGVNQSEALGYKIFDANQESLRASRDMASAQEMSAIGGGISSLGGALNKNLGPIGRITYGF